VFRRKRLWILLLLVVIAVFVWRRRAGGPAVENGSYLHVRLQGAYAEQPTDVIGRLVGETPNTLIGLLEAFHVASLDPRVAGALIEVAPLEVGWAKAEDLRDAFAAFRAAGKPIYAVLEQEAAASNLEYFIASVADKLYLAPATSAPLTGLSAQYVFFGGVWEKLDIQMHVEKIAEYKTMGDMLVNKKMSPAHREMANSLLDSVDGHFLARIAESRHLTPQQVKEIIDHAPSSPTDFQEAGLADGARYFTDVHKLDAGGGPLVKLSDYERVDASVIGLPVKQVLAVVYGVGSIVLGESGRSAMGTVMGSTTIADAIDEAAQNDSVKAIVFRVDSPGGSALASDLVWHATRRAREKKPVIVSMSDVAGSGGYYISAGASRILAQPMTLTGSIGVVFTRPDVSGLLTRLGVSTETLARGKYARINDVTAPFDADTRAKLLDEIENIYETFVDRVAAGRELAKDKVKEIGRGRVWTGAQAVENGLVDQTGGFMAAIAAAKEAAGIPAGEEVQLLHYPRAKPFAERLAEALSARMAMETRLPGEAELRAAFAVFPFVEGGALALMPEMIRIE